ncbi:hypothetical protein [Burkholderia sp. Tr-20390]|uniref:hypothetical protein n=1 Tax=Burkholderia sp. Tr-20390 TaxID=2703904 RepID=UPI00197F3A02|nr:hypothetical protein [Burkholderia sp. Tr-20390]MBN3729390.1 hypothetical protein [Burkholderia sp. Tr-20390]
MKVLTADSGYPDGKGGPADISVRQLADGLVGRTIGKVLFDGGDLVLGLSDGTAVIVRGNSIEDQSLAISVLRQA